MNDLAMEHLVVGPIQANCFILAHGATREAAVIDPGADAEAILSVLRKNRLTVVAVLNTHAHFDHTGANARLVKETGAPLMAPRMDGPMLPKAHLQAAVYGLTVEPSPPPDRLLNDGDAVTVGGQVVGVVNTPGHTAGGVSFTTSLGVFTGDSLFAGSIGRTDLPGGDFDTLIRSIRGRLLTLPDATKVFPGHGPFTTIGRERKSNPFLK